MKLKLKISRTFELLEKLDAMPNMVSVAYINLNKFQNDSPKKWIDLSNSFTDRELCNLNLHEVKYFWRNVFLYFVYF